MMINDNENVSFFELINTYSIRIPIIQRDYAQGRNKNQEICRNFLISLRTSIVKEIIINLDFVYGNITGKEFMPLDGQQRLTTLFLLHWYAFIKEQPDNNEIKDKLKNFSYETRLSSRRFCEALIENTIDIDSEKEKISDIIQDSEWFFASWQNDPTIRAMLNTIDMIHSLFSDVQNIWSALTELKLITFHLLILENFGLSDDLYIKMNARGKLLTPFENLKAEIQDKVLKNAWEDFIPEKEKFYHKIDTVWTDFLWNNFRKGNSVDNVHMNFITTLVMIKISIVNKLKAQERTEAIRRLNENNADRNLIQYIDKEIFQYIYKVYDLYSELIMEERVPSLSIEMWRHKPDKNLVNQLLVGENTSYTHKVLFYAQTEYLLRNSIVDEDKFLDWMRVIRNIVSRGDITIEGKRPDIIRSPETFFGVINLVHELTNGCDDIYNYLANNAIASSFAKEQVREEVLKSKIIVNYPLHKMLIHKLEDNELLRGKIMFALECAGYIGNLEEIEFMKLEEIQVVFRKYFNRDLESGEQEFDLLRRAMLTINVSGEYKFYNYWWSYWHAGEAEKRKLFPLFRELEYFIGRGDYKEYFKKLVLLLIDQDYDSIINSFEKPIDMEQWQYRLIKEENLLSSCKSKYIAISKEDSCCYLLKSKRPPNIEGSPVIS